MSKEAMKLALDALEGVWKGGFSYPPQQHISKAITALREALAAQPAQQFTEDAPADCKRLAEHGAPICGRCHMGPCKYTTSKAQPAQRKPLTDEEILNFGPGQPDAVWSYEDQLYFARAIEAAHSIKEQL